MTGAGISHVTTREPGGTKIGQRIRSLLLDPENSAMVARAELFLYAADRVQHLAEVVEPAISRGEVVLCDRFADSTTVYQGVARGLSKTLILKVHDMVLDGRRPDLTLLLDLPPEVGLSRAWAAVEEGGRSTTETRFESETLDFHRRIRQGFLDLAEDEPDRFRLVDATRTPEAVFEEILEHVKALMEKRRRIS